MPEPILCHIGGVIKRLLRAAMTSEAGFELPVGVGMGWNARPFSYFVTHDGL